MSRTYNTDPPLIRGYRDQGRPVDDDWRCRWSWHYSRYTYDLTWADYSAWVDSRPEPNATPRNWRRAWDNHGSSAKDRRLAQRRYRARVRDLIALERYDDILPPRATKGWEDWAW